MRGKPNVQQDLTRPCQGCGAEIPYIGYGHPPKWCATCKLKVNLAAVKRSYARRKVRLAGVEPVAEKRCIRCELVKPQSEYHKAKSRVDGLQAWCKQCASEYQMANRDAGNTRLRAWRARNPEAQGRYLKQARIDCIAHYSSTDPPTCACCGVHEPEFLVIDHIHGGGGKERRELGRSLFPNLRKKGYPDGYQVLCWNCNSAKHYHGMCPHERERQEQACA